MIPSHVRQNPDFPDVVPWHRQYDRVPVQHLRRVRRLDDGDGVHVVPVLAHRPGARGAAGPVLAQAPHHGVPAGAGEAGVLGLGPRVPGVQEERLVGQEAEAERGVAGVTSLLVLLLELLGGGCWGREGAEGLRAGAEETGRAGAGAVARGAAVLALGQSERRPGGRR